MAKGKHAAALFEVINAGKDRQNKSGALSTPKWWFKNRPKAETPASAPDESAPPERDENDPTLRAAESIFKPVAAAPPASNAARATAFRKLSSTEPGGGPLHRFGQQLTHRNAALFAAALLVIGGGAFVIGRMLGRGPAPATATPIETLRAGKPNANVLNLSPGSTGTNTNKPAPLSEDAGTFAGGAAPKADAPLNPDPSARTQSSAASAGFNPNAVVRRVVSMQYVVIQSYPKEADAVAAADICTRSGLPCTIQKGFWPQKPDWFTVIGANGFERTRGNPEYDAYIKLINQTSEKFAAKSRFRQFEPFLFTWKDATR